MAKSREKTFKAKAKNVLSKVHNLIKNVHFYTSLLNEYLPSEYLTHLKEVKELVINLMTFIKENLS